VASRPAWCSFARPRVGRVTDNHFIDTGRRNSHLGGPGSTVADSTITIDGNDFATNVGKIGYQPVDGVLHFTNSVP